MADNFSWILPGRVAGMAMPAAADIAWLKEQGITAVLSLTERVPLSLDGLEVCHVPIADMTCPPIERLHEAVGFIQRIVARGGGVAVHCMAGMGRTGTALAAYLVGEGMTPAEAVELVRALRPGSIETSEQERLVHTYAVYLEDGGA